MVKFCVVYRGRPEDPEAFDRYYRKNHVPIVMRWPRLRRVAINKAPQLNEEFYMIVELYFDCIEDLEAALGSPERREAGKDRAHFPNFYGTISYQILEIEELSV